MSSCCSESKALQTCTLWQKKEASQVADGKWN